MVLNSNYHMKSNLRECMFLAEQASWMGEKLILIAIEIDCILWYIQWEDDSINFSYQESMHKFQLMSPLSVVIIIDSLIQC